MARETLPNAPRGDESADAQDAALDILRERLDGTPLTGWRAPLADWLERAGVWFGAPATPALPLSVAPRRLSPRQSMARASVVALLIAATLFVLFNGVGATRGAFSALDRALHPPRPIPTLFAGQYVLRSLPPTAQHVQTGSLEPVAASPSVAYMCWVNPFYQGTNNPNPNSLLGPIFVARTANGGESWQSIGPPAVQGVGCTVATDAAGGPGALVITEPGYTTGGFCETPAIYLTRDGATWSSVPWPGLEGSAPCGAQYALDDGAIFAWSSDPYISGSLPTIGTGRMIVTRNGGATWASADATLNDATGLDIVGFQAGGRLLAVIPDVTGAPGSSTLVESTNFGATWHSLGDPPGAFITVYAATDPELHNGWGRLYVLGRPMVKGFPSADANALLLATAARAGAPWTQISLPPLLDGDQVTPMGQQVAPLGVGPSGALLVERGIVPTNDLSQLSPSQRLWAWDPTHRRWLLDPQPTFGNVAEFAWNWDHGALVLWVTAMQLGVPPTLHLFTRTYDARLSGA